jgi:hypothetical protein
MQIGEMISFCDSSIYQGDVFGVTTSVFRDGAYVGELWDNCGAEVVEMTKEKFTMWIYRKL